MKREAKEDEGQLWEIQNVKQPQRNQMSIKY